ncbi:MAG: cell division protein FtsZ, partial [Oscillospiraceae bacterium]
EVGIADLREHVDSIVVIPNDRLKQISEERITLANAFEIADSVLKQGVQSISELINVPGFINLDFADVCSVMRDMGFAHMGVGRASGRDKAETAASMAIASPLLETTITGAKGVIINITSSPDIDLNDVELAASMMTEAAHPDANIIWGVAFDETIDDEMIITVIATGFERTPMVDVTGGYTFKNNGSAVPVTMQQTPAAPQTEATGISKEDFDDIMKLLNERQ